RPDPSHPNMQPDYPPAARRLGEEGRVVLELTIRADGTIHQSSIVQTSGFNVLDQSALKTSMSWHYVPAMKRGTPVEAKARVPVIFKLLQDENDNYVRPHPPVPGAPSPAFE